MTGGAFLECEFLKGGKTIIKTDNAGFNAVLTTPMRDSGKKNQTPDNGEKPVFCEGCANWVPGGCVILYNIETGRLESYPRDAVKRGFCTNFEKEKTDAAAIGEIPDFGWKDFMETDKPYAYLYNLIGKVSELRRNQIKADIADGAAFESLASATRIPFDTLYDAYCRDRDAAASEEKTEGGVNNG